MLDICQLIHDLLTCLGLFSPQTAESTTGEEGEAVPTVDPNG